MTATPTPMTSAGACNRDAHLLRRALDSVARRQQWYTSGAGLLRVSSVWLAVAMALVIVDAMWPLAAALRAAVVLAMAIGLAFSCWRHWPRREGTQVRACSAARRIETLCNLPSNLVINAVWLAPLANQDDDSLATRLAQRVLTRAGRAIQAIDLRGMVDRVSFDHQRVRLLLVVLVWLVAFLVSPRLVVGGLARFMGPYGDHPPFSLTVFEVDIRPLQPVVGDDARVSVRLAGRLPDRAELATVHEGDPVARRWAMTRSGQGVYERQLLSVRQPITLWIETATGRSKRYRVEPTQPPVRDGVAQQIRRGDVEADHADGKREADHPAGHGEGGAQVLREVSAQLDAMADRAGRLRDEAIELLGRMPGRVADGDLAGRDRGDAGHESTLSPGGEDSASSIRSTLLTTSVMGRVARLNERLSGFAMRARGLTDAAEAGSQAAAGGGRQPRSEPWANVATLLGQLRLPQAGPGSGSGKGGSAAVMGVTGAPGSDPLTVRNVTPWLAEVIATAGHDRQLLEQARVVLDRAFAQAGIASEGGRSASVGAVDARTGGYDEQGRGTTKLPVQADAVTEGIPAEYRQMVAWYFARIASEQGGTEGSPQQGR